MLAAHNTLPVSARKSLWPRIAHGVQVILKLLSEEVFDFSRGELTQVRLMESVMMSPPSVRYMTIEAYSKLRLTSLRLITQHADILPL